MVVGFTPALSRMSLRYRKVPGPMSVGMATKRLSALVACATVKGVNSFLYCPAL